MNPLCPKCHVVMDIKMIKKLVVVNSIKVIVIEDSFVCPICELQVGTVQTAGRVQQDIISTIKRRMNAVGEHSHGDVSEETWRNVYREKKKRYEEPTLEEGFDEVIYV